MKSRSTWTRRSYRPTLYNAVSVRRAPQPLTFTTKLKYSDQFIGGSVNANTCNLLQCYRANGCFDPNVTAAGHQPKGFDQIMALYTYFTVTACTIRACVWNGDTASICRAGVTLLNTSTTLSAVGTYDEFEGTRYSTIEPIGSTAADVRPAKSYHVNITNKCPSIAAWVGTKDIMDDADLRGTTASDPANQLFWHVWAQSIDGNAVTSINGVIVIEYTVTFSSPATLAQS